MPALLRRGIHGLARRLRSWSRKAAAKQAPAPLAPTLQADRPNTPTEWEREYLSPVSPVAGLAHPVARIVSELTARGDVLLEAGCGSARLSAELAHAGRQIVLADFSERILARALEVFVASGLGAPQTVVCDLTARPLPVADASVDWVWSSGVLEHWPDEEVLPIVSEMARIARKGVISLVPHAGCLFYRWGKACAEARGTWPYGRELPRTSLRQVFERAGLSSIQERDCWDDVAPDFLQMVGVPGLPEAARAWWNSLSLTDPARTRQGYLLLTVGRREPAP